jgi:hypothetical protein
VDAAQPIHILAMVICDSVARDDLTRRLTIINTLSGYVVDAFPATLTPFAVYLAMSEVHQPAILRISVVNEADEILFETEEGYVAASNPTIPVEFVMRFSGVVIEAPGDYFLRLTADGVYIVERRLGIALAKKERPE